MPDERCPGCGLVLPASDGPTHASFGSSAACWALFGEVIAKEFSDPGYGRWHQHTVDAYAGQHPAGDGTRRRQSVAVHLAGLCLLLEHGRDDPGGMPYLRQHIAERVDDLPPLRPPPTTWGITVADVAAAASADEHARRVRRWAEDVWNGWSAHHDTVRAWVRAAGVV
ncbi:MAG: DUF5946 family protein [Actinomycetota bacterium]